MNIAIPVNNKSAAADVAASFGRTQYFLIYDTETNSSEYLDNSAASSQGGAGIKAAQCVVDSGAVIVIAPQCGENAANVLKAATIKLYKSVPGTALENLAAFAAGSLALLEEFHAGFHHHGGS